MNINRRFIATVMMTTLAACLAIAGCSDDETPTAPVETVNVDVFFDINVDDQPLQLNSMIYTNDAGTKYSVKTLRFVLTDITLHSTDGYSMEVSDLHYFSIADATTQTLEFTGGIAHKDWNRATFTFGLDETKNVRDKYINMVKFTQDMVWPTGLGPMLGYHYMQLEGNYELAAGGTSGYTTHTGAHQLASDPANHYHFSADIAVTQTHIHPGDTGELTIHVNLSGWYRDHDPVDGTDTAYDFKDLEGTPMGQMIMANPTAQTKLRSNGPFCFSASLESTSDHDHP